MYENDHSYELLLFMYDILDHGYEILLIMDDQYWSVHHIMTPTIDQQFMFTPLSES